ncbi:MAG: divalent-cation tolerance protein CutA [Rhodospirillales bacterium]|nr:divalent-cation tolerance protein CutA [Alphaproteobacteria bacterium]USO03448.1 MAG: divalent-cation tolerance protein CutA [Rhodospirillales bacterium]
MKKFFVYITAGSREEAQKIAEHLIEARLAACVNVLPEMSSVYRWEGKVCREREVALIAKTTENKLEDLTAAVKSIHSYDVPCIVALPIEGGYAPFLNWIEQELPD